MIDHTNGTLYTNQDVAYFSYYSVSLFILLMGVNVYGSYKKVEGGFVEKIKKSVWGIVKPYVIATLIYHITLYKFFDLEILISQLIHFNVSGPLYYVALYIQLIIISPLIFRWVNADTKIQKNVKHILGLILVIVISYFTTNYSNILNIYGGGGKLLGGTYLVLLYIGMLIGKYSNFNIQKKGYLIVGVVCSIFATVGWWRFICWNKLNIDLKIPFGGGVNPPSISFSLYAIFMAITLLLIGKLLDNHKGNILNKLWMIMGDIGRHTLYIFLYHCLFLHAVFPFFRNVYGIEINNLWLKRVIYFGIMIGGSLVIEFVLEKIQKFCEKIYCGRS